MNSRPEATRAASKTAAAELWGSFAARCQAGDQLGKKET